MSLSSEMESIVCPTLYQRAALRRSSFSASFAGAMMWCPAFDLVLDSVCRYIVCVADDCVVARRVLWFTPVKAGLLRDLSLKAFPIVSSFPSCLDLALLRPDHQIHHAMIY